MSKKNKRDKNCGKCGDMMFNVNFQRRYCDNCNLNRTKKYRVKRQKYLTKKRDMPSKLKENFFEVYNKHGAPSLISKRFGEVSELSPHSYTNCFKVGWLEIVKMYKKEEELVEYVYDEICDFLENGNSESLKRFADEHEYINYRLLLDIGLEYLIDRLGLKRKRYNLKVYEENFHNLIKKYGRIPLYNEFMESSKIPITSYAQRFKLRGKIYQQIVERYSTDKQLEEYEINRLDHKSIVGRENHQGERYSDEELKIFFKQAMDEYVKNIGSLPSRRIFDKLAKVDSSLYRRRLEMSFMDICEFYGYKVNREANKAERFVLKTIKKLLKSSYESQKQFDWLIGINNYPLYCDGYYKDRGLVVEFNGRQHYEPVEHFGGMETFLTQQANDKCKKKLIPEHGLKLLIIDSDEPYWDIEYLRSRLVEIGVLKVAS